MKLFQKFQLSSRHLNNNHRQARILCTLHQCIKNVVKMSTFGKYFGSLKIICLTISLNYLSFDKTKPTSPLFQNLNIYLLPTCLFQTEAFYSIQHSLHRSLSTSSIIPVVFPVLFSNSNITILNGWCQSTQCIMTFLIQLNSFPKNFLQLSLPF